MSSSASSSCASSHRPCCSGVRCALEHGGAAAVIMPAADFGPGGPDQADTRTIKTLATELTLD